MDFLNRNTYTGTLYESKSYSSEYGPFQFMLSILGEMDVASPHIEKEMFEAVENDFIICICICICIYEIIFVLVFLPHSVYSNCTLLLLNSRYKCVYFYLFKFCFFFWNCFVRFLPFTLKCGSFNDDLDKSKRNDFQAICGVLQWTNEL